MSGNSSFIASLAGSTYTNPGDTLTPSYSSSPLDLAGYTSPPVSTLDVGSLNEAAYQNATRRSITDIISGLGNVVLGGIAISRMPSNNITSVQVPSAVQGRATGATIVPASAAPGSQSVMGLLIVGIIIVGIVLLAKRL
jgi:hypothetical protein